MQKPEKLTEVGNTRLLCLRPGPTGEIYAEFDRPVVVCDHENDCVLYDGYGTPWRGEALSFVQVSPTSLSVTVTGGYSSSSALFLFIPEGTRALKPLEGGRVLAGLGVITLT